jgi:hypothetical protein
MDNARRQLASFEGPLNGHFLGGDRRMFCESVAGDVEEPLESDSAQGSLSAARHTMSESPPPFPPPPPFQPQPPQLPPALPVSAQTSALPAPAPPTRVDDASQSGDALPVPQSEDEESPSSSPPLPPPSAPAPLKWTPPVITKDHAIMHMEWTGTIRPGKSEPPLERDVVHARNPSRILLNRTICDPNNVQLYLDGIERNGEF